MLPVVKQCLSLTQTAQAKNYCLSKPPKTINIKQLKQWLTGNNYNMAMQLLYDKNAYLKHKIAYETEEDEMKKNKTKKLHIVYFPNYKKIAKLLLRSAIHNNNALSANIYYSLTKSYLEFKDEIEKNNNYKKIVKIMYADNQCSGYEAYGNLLLKENKIKKAAKVFKEGAKICKNIQYFGMLLRTKAFRIGFQQNLNAAIKKNTK